MLNATPPQIVRSYIGIVLADLQIDGQNVLERLLFHRDIDKPKAQYEQSESQTKGLVNIYEFYVIYSELGIVPML